MTIDQFWRLIEQCRMAGERRLAVLEEMLRKLSPREMVSFEGHSWDLLSISYRREIWAVAAIIDPLCSQAAFDAVRGWMILEGKEFFTEVISRPEKLAERVTPGQVPWRVEGEQLLALVSRVYQNMTGDELPTLPRTVPYVLKGQRWNEQDLPDLYPEQWRKYRP
jgi:hypothetical protein